MTKGFKYPMNVVAKDKVSGFSGIILVRSAHLFGCSQYGITPQELDSDGSTKKTEHFDESRIEIVDDRNAVDGASQFDSIFVIPLGSEVKDKVSNFQGKALVAMQHLHNCNQYYVEPPVDKMGKQRDGGWFDEGRLDITGKGISPKEVESKKSGSVFTRDLPQRK